MSEEKISIDKMILEWAGSEEGFLVPLRSLNDLNKGAFDIGFELLKKYIESNKECLSIQIVQVLIEINVQLSFALQRSVRSNDSEKTNAIIEIIYQVQMLVY